MEDGTPEVAPRSFHTEESFGCVSGTAIGDWMQTFLPESNGHQADPVWWQVGMGGIFHCSGFFAQGQKRGGTDLMLREAGYTVDLGVDDVTGAKLYLWQIGIRGGSRYLILSRRPDEENDRFNVLDPHCVAGTVREAAPNNSIFLTAYCAVSDKSAMRKIAAEAASRPPTGIMEYVGRSASEPG